MAPEVGVSAIAEWGVAARPIHGERVSGDRHIAVSLPSWLLLAVVDGLGHGVEAERAARAAARVIEDRAAGRPEEHVLRCHTELRRTRGVAMTVLTIDGESDQMVWLGVGNVQAVLLRASGDAPRGKEWAPLRGGVVGYVLPPLRPGTVRLQPDDVLVLATDGVRPVFGDWPDPGEAPDDIAARILGEQGRDSDDALVLAARYRGGAPANEA
jgi:serine phosphatase RsbU (regulator of sigma subunit)